MKLKVVVIGLGIMMMNGAATVSVQADDRERPRREDRGDWDDRDDRDDRRGGHAGYRYLREAREDAMRARFDARRLDLFSAHNSLESAKRNIQASGTCGHDRDADYALREVEQGLQTLRDWRLTDRQKAERMSQDAQNAVVYLNRALENDGPGRPGPRPRPQPGRYTCSAVGVMHPRDAYTGFAQFSLDAAKASAMQTCQRYRRVCRIDRCWSTR